MKFSYECVMYCIIIASAHEVLVSNGPRKAFFNSEIMVLGVVLQIDWCFGCFQQCRSFISVLVVFDSVGLPKYLSHTAKQTVEAFYWCFGCFRQCRPS